MIHTVHSIDETCELAKQIARLVLPIDCVTLSGDLGVGKTVFARAFIQAFCGNITVQSPTFLLAVPYEGKRDQKPVIIHHFDLYRIKHPSELSEIGLEEALESSLCLIEWPEIAEAMLPEDRLEISISHQGDARIITLTAKGNWQNRLNNV